MADTFTPHLNLDKPEVGGSTDTWGNKINANYDLTDSLFGPGPVLLLSSGGTGASTASAARTNLGCGTMATQNANAITVTGGVINTAALLSCSLDQSPVGMTIPAAAKVTSLQVIGGGITFADGSTQAASASVLNSPTVVTVNASGTCSAGPIFLTELVDASTGAITRTLPSSVGIVGHIITGKKWDSSTNAVTYQAQPGQTIDGSPSPVQIYRQNDAADFQSTGPSWILK